MREFEAQHGAYAERVRQSIEDQPLMSVMLGAVVGEVVPGRVEIYLDVIDNMLQPFGNVHGAVAHALADSAAGYAAQTLLGLSQDIVTVESKINFMAPGIGQRMLARGKVIRAGRTLFVCDADVFAINDGEEKLFAHMVTTMMAVDA